LEFRYRLLAHSVGNRRVCLPHPFVSAVIEVDLSDSLPN
jgi:hypothetical protein